MNYFKPSFYESLLSESPLPKHSIFLMTCIKQRKSNWKMVANDIDHVLKSSYFLESTLMQQLTTLNDFDDLDKKYKVCV